MSDDKIEIDRDDEKVVEKIYQLVGLVRKWRTWLIIENNRLCAMISDFV